MVNDKDTHHTMTLKKRRISKNYVAALHATRMNHSLTGHVWFIQSVKSNI